MHKTQIFNKISSVCTVSVLYSVISYFLFGNTNSRTFLSCITDYLYWNSSLDAEPLSIVLPILPIFCFCALLSDAFVKDFSIIKFYVIPRLNSVKKYYLSKVIYLFMTTLLFVFSIYITILVFNIGFSNKDFFNIKILVIVFQYFLFVFTSILFVNVISLYVPSKYSLLAYILFILLHITLILFIKDNTLIQLINPVVHFYATWKVDSVGHQLFSQYYIGNLRIKSSSSIEYFVFSTIFLYIIGLWKTEKKVKEI